MKKYRLLAFLLAGVMILMSLTSCSEKNEDIQKTDAEETVEHNEENTEGNSTEEDRTISGMSNYDKVKQKFADGIDGYTLVLNGDSSEINALASYLADVSASNGCKIYVSDKSIDGKEITFIYNENVKLGLFEYFEEEQEILYSEIGGLLRAVNCLLSLQDGGYDALIELAKKMKDIVPQFYEKNISAKNIYANNMLFQQNKPFSVAGTGENYTDVTVRLCNGEKTVTQNSAEIIDGQFTVTLDEQKGSYTEYDLYIYADGKLVQNINNVVFGELWIAAGQSNMEYALSADADGRELELNDKYLRAFYTVRETYPYEEQNDYQKGKCIWLTAANGYIKSASALGYFFATNLRESLDVPVGYLNLAVGGSAISEWLSRDTINSNADLVNFYKEKNMYVGKNDWDITLHAQITSCYNLRVSPIKVFEVAGMIWYQGENDIINGNYKRQMEVMHKQFCKDFGFENMDMPLIYTTIAPYVYNNISQCRFAEFQLELASFALENTSFSAVISNNDVSPEFDSWNSPIHPRTKKPIGERMAKSALNLVYGDVSPSESSSPALISSEIIDGSVYMTFKNVGDGLGILDGAHLKGFLICGEDGVFEKANAEIYDKDTVRVWSEYITQPVSASYAFYSATYTANLCSTYNGSSLYPALPAISVQNSNMIYTSYLDWAECDIEERFHLRPGNADISRYYPTWINGQSSTAQTELEIDENVKISGNGSLKISYLSSGYISVTPTMDAEKYGIYELFRDTETSFVQYDILRFYVKGLDDSTRFCNIVFTDTQGNKYTANGTQSSADGEFDFVSVDISNMQNISGGCVANDVLVNICAIEFVFEASLTSGTIYIDGISFGVQGGAAI